MEIESSVKASCATVAETVSSAEEIHVSVVEVGVQEALVSHFIHSLLLLPPDQALTQ